MPTFRQVEYMALPRLAALSEVQWSQPQQKDYQDFTQRIPHLVDLYKKFDYRYAKHIFDVKGDITSVPEDKAIYVNLSTIDDATIYYTLDGTEPTPKSERYKGNKNNKSPLAIKQSATLKAAVFRGEEPSHIFQEEFNFNKATVCPIQLLQPINHQYEFNGAPALVDGLKATDTNFQSGRWIGFYNNDMEVVIDLGQNTEISKIGFNTCVEKGAWIFDTRGVEISISEDGKNFNTMVKQDFPAQTEANPNLIYRHFFDFPKTSTRYVKVKALSEQSIPSWHNGKGRPAFLFVDEIIVE